MPFGDMLIAYPRASLGEPEAFPVTCYAPDPERTGTRWVDLGTCRPVKVWWECEGDIFDEGLEVSTFAGIAYAHRRFIEARYLDARGQVHEQFVAGELQRRPVHISRVIHLGKESSHLSEVQSGLMGADTPTGTWQHWTTIRSEGEGARGRVRPWGRSQTEVGCPVRADLELAKMEQTQSAR
jgi:hypothetical protein